MGRATPVLAVVAAALAAALLALWIHARGLKREILEARASVASASPASIPADPGVPRKELEAEKARADGLEKRVGELEGKLAEAEKAAAKKPGKPKKDDPTPGDPTEPKMSPEFMEVLQKMRKTLCHGGDIPEEAVKDLGLDEVQKAALQRAMESEEKRLDESMRRFYAEQVDPNAPGLYEKGAKELILTMMGKIGPDLEELQKLPPEQAEKVHLSSSIEELMGPDKFLSKLSREVHGVRLKTYEDLAMSLTPEQLAKVRDTYLREGSMYYKGMPLEFGLAPKDMKK